MIYTNISVLTNGHRTLSIELENSIFMKDMLVKNALSLKLDELHSNSIQIDIKAIQINSNKYYSDKLKDIRELYSYKKELMKTKFISPIPNNQTTPKGILRFSPLSIKDFSKDYIFPYKSTWITPRFDN